MGNFFSYFFTNSNKVELEESLLKPLNSPDEYTSLIDINTLNSQVNILEKTTQDSLINISKDVKHLFDEIEYMKNKINIIENCENNQNNSIYYDFNDKHDDNYKKTTNFKKENTGETF